MRVVFFDLTLWRFGFEFKSNGLAVDLGPLGLFFPV